MDPTIDRQVNELVNWQQKHEKALAIEAASIARPANRVAVLDEGPLDPSGLSHAAEAPAALERPELASRDALRLTTSQSDAGDLASPESNRGRPERADVRPEP